MLTKTKTIITLAYAFTCWAGVPLQTYAIDLIPQPRGQELWQYTTTDGVTVRSASSTLLIPAMLGDITPTAKAPTRALGRTYTVTAYNSVPEQTDSTPCIAANGADICKLHAQGDQTCAAALPFGTLLDVPGFGRCTVRDRLAPKYASRIDIHMGKDITRARAWGKKQLTITVINK